MLAYEFCKKLILQFSDHPKFPETEQGLRVRIETLQKRGKSESHATTVIEKLIERSQFCPGPAEIYAAADEVRIPESQSMRADPNCHRCNGSGWMHEERPGWDGAPCDFGGLCPCRGIRSGESSSDWEHRPQTCRECHGNGYVEIGKDTFASCECHIGGSVPDGFISLLNAKSRQMKPSLPGNVPEWLLQSETRPGKEAV